MKKSETYVEYDHNNSGGRWWLTDKDWEALEKAGWKVDWREPFLNARATSAKRYGVKSLAEAVSEWERVTGKASTDAGCPCCGPPHHFTLYKNGKYAESGPTTHYEASWG